MGLPTSQEDQEQAIMVNLRDTKMMAYQSSLRADQVLPSKLVILDLSLPNMLTLLMGRAMRMVMELFH